MLSSRLYGKLHSTASNSRPCGRILFRPIRHRDGAGRRPRPERLGDLERQDHAPQGAYRSRGDRQRVDLTLQVGATTESITVTGAAAVVESDSAGAATGYIS